MTPKAKVLGGRYQIDQVLGKGGMADVYLGTDQVLGRQVAVKVLGSSLARDQSFVARFRREAQAAAALNHPNVVGVFDTGSDDGTHYIVMEYVQGKTLADIIREDAPLLPERAVEIAEAAAGGLAFAHAQGIVHRDVKPGNIMLTPSGDVKVMDFGIARATTAGSDSLTQTATVLGTATYFSPEQAQGEKVDARSDIYALGCVLYEMLTSHPPFAGESPVAVAYKHVKEDPVPPSALHADIPSDLDAIVLKCLAKNPDNRYQSAPELASDLGRFRTGQPVTATPLMSMGATAAMEGPTATSVLPATAAEPVREPRRWVAAAVLGLLAVVLALGLFFLARSLLGPGQDLITVADVRGRTVPAATRILERQGFRVRVDRNRQPSEEFAKGRVSDYFPEEAERGDTITLIVSSGPPVELATVPNVVCQPVDQAISRIENAGFNADVAGRASNPDCESGEVAQTDPPGGTRYEKGKTVSLFTKPEPPTTPPPTTPPPTTPPPTTPPPTTPPSPTPSDTGIIGVGSSPG